QPGTDTDIRGYLAGNDVTMPAALPTAKLGADVSLDGNTAVVGARDYDGRGAAFVFTRDGILGDGDEMENWSLSTRLDFSGSELGDDFATSVAISGDTIVIGAPNARDGAGVVYVYQRLGDQWTLDTTLASGVGGDRDFGASVDIDVDTIVVGAQGENAVYVYELVLTDWVERQRLSGSGEYGTAVAVDNRTIIVGAPTIDGRGAAFVYTTAGANWVQNAVLKPDAGGVRGGRFGYSVDVSGNQAIVGAPDVQMRKGAAYIFELEVTDFVVGDVDAQDNTISVGPGHGFLPGDEVIYSGAGGVVGGLTSGDRYFVIYDPASPDRIKLAETLELATDDAGPTPIELTPSTNPGGQALTLTLRELTSITHAIGRTGDQFGFSVAIQGTQAAIGSPFRERANDNPPPIDNVDEGEAFAYSLKNGKWRLETNVDPLAGADALGGDLVGYAVAISDGRVLLGAPQLLGRPGQDEIDTQGAGYVFIRTVFPPINVAVAERIQELITGGRANAISGTINGVATATFNFFDVPEFTLQTGAGDDQITIAEAGLTALGLSTFVIDTDGGDDTLTTRSTTLKPPAVGDYVGAGSAFNVIDGQAIFDGGTGTNTIVADADADWTLRAQALSSGRDVELEGTAFGVGDVDTQDNSILVGAGHGFLPGDEVIYGGPNGVVGGLTSGDRYFVIYDPATPNRIRLAETREQAIDIFGPMPLERTSSTAVAATLVQAMDAAGPTPIDLTPSTDPSDQTWTLTLRKLSSTTRAVQQMTLRNVQQAILIGGDSGNRLEVSQWTGQVVLDGAGGADQITVNPFNVPNATIAASDGGDHVTFVGTENDDLFSVSADEVTVGGTSLSYPAGVVLRLAGLDGADTFNVFDSDAAILLLDGNNGSDSYELFELPDLTDVEIRVHDSGPLPGENDSNIDRVIVPTGATGVSSREYRVGNRSISYDETIEVVELNSQSPILTVPGTGAADNIVIRGDRLWINNAVFDLTNTIELTVDGLGGNDTFTVIDVLPTLQSLSLEGGSGSDRLFGPSVASQWQMTGVNEGVMFGLSIRLSFVEMENLIGGSTGNLFDFGDDQAAVSGGVTGGTGSDVLSYGGRTDSVQVDLAAQSATGIPTLRSIDHVVGSGNSDSIRGPNIASTIRITGTNAGAINDVTTFSSFENVTGGSDEDTFLLGSASALEGTIDGGGAGNQLVITMTPQDDTVLSDGLTLLRNGAATRFANIASLTIDTLGGLDTITANASLDGPTAVSIDSGDDDDNIVVQLVSGADTTIRV
ncbi:MAG: FG-GAP repeat protein, partial [Pirellulales bacterium]